MPTQRRFKKRSGVTTKDQKALIMGDCRGDKGYDAPAIKEATKSPNPPVLFKFSHRNPNLDPMLLLLIAPVIRFLTLEDDPTSSEVDPTYHDPEGDILQF
ncbi:hypothetical protein Tco_1504610 [Tanacetum coccineum]